MLLWCTDLMNGTEEVRNHRPNVSTILSSVFVMGDLNAATRGLNVRNNSKTGRWFFFIRVATSCNWFLAVTKKGFCIAICL